MAHAPLQPGSPGARSDVSTPTKRLVSGVLSLSPFKRGGAGGGLSSTGGGGSPYGSEGGASAGSGQRSLIPSYSHAVQKREVIRQQEEALGMLRQQLQQQGAELGRCASKVAYTRAHHPHVAVSNHACMLVACTTPCPSLLNEFAAATRCVRHPCPLHAVRTCSQAAVGADQRARGRRSPPGTAEHAVLQKQVSVKAGMCACLHVGMWASGHVWTSVRPLLTWVHSRPRGCVRMHVHVHDDAYMHCDLSHHLPLHILWVTRCLLVDILVTNPDVAGGWGGAVGRGLAAPLPAPHSEPPVSQYR